MKRLVIPFALLAFFSTSTLAEDVINHKSPYCGCCSEWAKHMQQSGFTVKEVFHQDMAPIKTKLGVPADLVSCHSAEINGYVFEGHVPAQDIKTFLASPPKNAKGLAVPGMPMGSPGMDFGEKREAYSVMTFDAQGHHNVFKHYQAM